MGRQLNKARDDHENALGEAKVEIAQNTAASDYSNPDEFHKGIVESVNWAVKKAAKLGYDKSDPITQIMVRGEVTTQFNKVFKAAMAGKDLATVGRLLNDTAAGGKYAGSIDPLVRAAAVAQFQGEVLSVSAQDLVNKSQLLNPGNLTAQRQYIKDNSEGQLEKAALATLSSDIIAAVRVDNIRRAHENDADKELTRRTKQQDADLKTAQKATLLQALDNVDKGVWTKESDIPASATYLLGSKKSGVVAYMDAKIAPPKETTSEGFQLLSVAHSNSDRLATTSLAFARELMNDSDFSTFKGIKTDQLKEAGDPTTATLTQKINARLNSMGQGKTKSDEEAYGNIVSMIYGRISAAGGIKKLKDTEIDAIIEDVTNPTNIRKNTHIFGLFTSTSSDDSKAEQFGDIDKDVAADIGNGLKKLGLPSDPASILKAFKRINE